MPRSRRRLWCPGHDSDIGGRYGGLLTGASLCTSLAVSSIWPPYSVLLGPWTISRCVITFKCRLLQALHMCDCPGGYRARGKGIVRRRGGAGWGCFWARARRGNAEAAPHINVWFMHPKCLTRSQKGFDTGTVVEKRLATDFKSGLINIYKILSNM